ncbi:MAG: hypothetical protein SNJ64_01665 [Endomicrobiia bacterium]
MNNQKKELSDILKELHKVLDDLSTDTGVKRVVSDSALEDLKNKIKEKEEKINSVVVSSESLEKKEENNIIEKPTISSVNNLEEKVLDKTNLKETELSLKKEENRDIEKTEQEISSIQMQNVENKSSEPVTVKEETEKVVTKPELPSDTLKESATSVVEQSIKSKSQNVINTIFIYPLSVPESRDIFYEQINNTLKRVSKKPAEMKPVYEISFTDPDTDLIKNEQEILDKINSYDVKGIFIITNESVSLDDFVSKFSNEVFMIKLIKYSELKTKSIYLDIAIDILLTLK